MDFDEPYRAEKEHVWGTRPLPEIENNISQFVAGKVLDLGAGDGRNTLYLAQRGFSVTAVDIAPTAIERIRRYAKELDLSVDAEVADIATYAPKDQYENIISNFTLHFLRIKTIPNMFQRILDATVPGGINLIQDFTPNGPLFSPGTDYFWPKQNELKELYEKAGWQIIQYSESMGKTKQLGPDGKPYLQQSSTVIAKKP